MPVADEETEVGVLESVDPSTFGKGDGDHGGGAYDSDDEDGGQRVQCHQS